MGDMDPKHWPFRTKAAAIEGAMLAAQVAAIAGGNHAATVSRWPGSTDFLFETGRTEAYAEFLVLSPGVAGDVLFRWAAARQEFMADPESFELEPAPVRIAFHTFAATFHAVLQLLVGEVCNYEARRTAAIMAPLQRVPLRDTIFETDKDDGPFHHLGPRGSFTPPAPRYQAEAPALSVAGGGPALAAVELGVADPSPAGADSVPAAAPAMPSATAAAPADPLTNSPSGDHEHVADGSPKPAGDMSTVDDAPSQGDSTRLGAPADDQRPSPISGRKRKG